MRLLFAFCVFVFHAWALAGIAPFGDLETQLGVLAEISIQGFFIVSGALVLGSLDRSASLVEYAEKRVRRLYPAYAVVVITPAVTSGFLTGWAAPAAVAKYLTANLVFLNFLAPDLPGLFEGQRFTEVNGALWTLKIEVMFYIALPVIAQVLRLFGKAWWVGLLLLYSGGVAWSMGMPMLLDHELAPEIARQLPGQMAFFASGMALWKLWDTAKAKPGMFGLVGAFLLALSFAHPLAEFLRAAGLAGLIACAAFAPGPRLDAARFGDVSYGLYITHFPILQGMIMLGLFASFGFALSIAISTFTVLLASLLLWHLVEKPALRRDSHYRKVSEAA
ncbi:acyltransferase family protein [Henriciella pelagia]|uniref:acyltransferase family protein n=1 Tax=Henriciella pelagia TaxID=1977912 RepID=UPI003514ABF9